MKLKTALMICTAIAFPTHAAAAPVLAFVGGLTGAGFAGVAGTLASSAWLAGSWLAGSGLFGIAANLLISAVLTPRQSRPDIEVARVTSRLSNGPRWQLAGRVAVGGYAGAFGEHDSDGNFWYIVAHGDAEITSTPTYMLDDIVVEVSPGVSGVYWPGEVITDDFCLDDDGKQYEGTGPRRPVFRLYTVSPTAALPYGVKPAEFTAAFPTLPADFLLAGVCYTIVRCRALEPDRYAAGYRWRGAFGLGEPSVSIVGNFNRMYDPRNGAHNVNVPSTWTATDGNPAIIAAWFKTAPFGNNEPMASVNWAKVVEAANHCDRIVLDRSGNPIPIYRCGVAFPDNKPRHECMNDILATFDAFAAFDGQGLWYPVAGVYAAPTLTFTAERDIISAQTQIIDDGEAALDGVIVEYISPDHNYTKQQSAPWINTEYYDGVSEPNFQTVPILGVQNHHQAVTLAKSIGLRIGAPRRAALQVGVKGILAANQRTIQLNYDASFTGVYEIVSPVQGDGMFSFAVVPIAADRWDLGIGEEGIPPQPPLALDIDTSLEVATGVSISIVSVSTSGGAAVRLDATFAAPSRPDRTFVFRYNKTGESLYEYFVTDMRISYAYSAIVQDGQSYDVAWQTVTAGGRATTWSTPLTFTTTADTVAPPALVAFSAADGVGQSVVSFTTANSSHQDRVLIYRGVTTVFGSSVQVGPPIVAGANISNSVTNTGLAAGTYYYWGVPQNGSGIWGPPSGPDAAVVT